MDAPLLPSQLARPQADAFLPEKRLMVAVLAGAIAEYEKYAAATDARSLRRFAEVEYWFMSDDTGWPFSFVNICDKLGLDVPSIRAAMRDRQGRSSRVAARPAFFGHG
jgi:hypothetical protein